MTTRVCNLCRVEKDLEYFHRCKSFPLGRVYTCKECAKAKSRDWNRLNAERKKAQGKEHYKKNKDSYLNRAKKSTWHKENPDRIRELSRLRYYRNNGASLVAKYRHIRKRAAPLWLTVDHQKEIDAFYYLARDLEIISGQKYHVDHITPIKGKLVCGLHVPWNLQILPADLNLSKGNRTEGN